MSSSVITDERDELHSGDDERPAMELADPIPNGDEEKARVERTLRELRNPKRRRWTYLKAARRARWYDQQRKRGQRSHRILTATEFQLLFALVEYADPDLTSSFPGVPSLAREEGWSESRVRKVLASLVKKGWIKRWPQPGYASMANQFMIPPCALASWDSGWKGPRPFDPPERGD